MQQKLQKSKEPLVFSPIFAVAVLILVACLFVSRTAPPANAPVIVPAAVSPSTAKDASADPRQFMKRIRETARKTHGDWMQLSFEDQRLLNGYSGGHGRTMFEMLAQDQSVSSSSKK